jgi:ABC-type phosphate transport system permease subunit
MSDLHREIEKRYQKRHRNKIFTWINFLVRLILLIVVIMIIRFLSNPETEIFRNFLMGNSSQNTKTENIQSE